MALKFEFEVNLKEHLATPATPSAWPQGQVQTFCWGKGSALMLLINCGRKGSPLQTPKIPRKNIIKSSLCTSQPHHSAQPRLGLDRKITPAPCRSLNHKWVPQDARPWVSAGGWGSQEHGWSLATPPVGLGKPQKASWSRKYINVCRWPVSLC